MRYLHILLSVFFCNFITAQQKAFSQNKNVELKNIDSYINSYFLNEGDLSLKNIHSYLSINMKDYEKLSIDKQKIFWDYLNMMNGVHRNNLKECKSSYKVIAHSKIEIEKLKHIG